MFWYITVRLEFGELVAPVNDQAKGGMLGDVWFEPASAPGAALIKDARRSDGVLVLSYSSFVYVSQSQVPFDFWSNAVNMYLTPPQYACNCCSEL